MENLKFHNTVGQKLEELTKKRGTRAFTADEIDSGMFVEAMLDVLRADTKKLPLYSDFFNKCNDYYGIHKYGIPDDEAIALFDIFRTIIDE